MKAFELLELTRAQEEGDRLYHEFLRLPALSMGLYVLPAGSIDPQLPHNEDEIYYVTRGRATIHVSGEDRPVKVGGIIHVPPHATHCFHSIEEDLHVLVFFAPAESG